MKEMRKPIFICVGAVAFFILLISIWSQLNKPKMEPIKNEQKNVVELEENTTLESNDKIDFCSELDKKYPIEEGFMTTIKGGLTDEEVTKNNLLLKKSYISINDRLEAKRVAENFVQAFAVLDVDQSEKYMNIAIKYAVDDLHPSIKADFSNYSKTIWIKGTLTSLHSEERTNKDKNDYIYIDVVASAEYFDKNNQSVGEQSTDYLVKLLKIDGEIKVIDYKLNIDL